MSGGGEGPKNYGQLHKVNTSSASRVGGGSFSISSNQCDENFLASISSPDENEINELSVGDILDIEIENSPEKTLLLKYRNKIVGSIIGEKKIALVSCIENFGFKFKAEVKSKNDADVKILVFKLS